MITNDDVRSRASPSEAGFTLVELLVSLSLLALIIALVPGALQAGRRAWATSAGIGQSSETTVALSFLERRLEEAMPLFASDGRGLRRIAFSGTADSLDFVAPSPTGPFGGGLYRFGLKAAFAEDRAPGALTLKLALFQTRTTSDSPAEDNRVLAGNLETLRFRYFGSQKRDTEAAWQSEWTAPDRLPDLVEISILSKDKAARAPGILRVELRLRPRL